MLASRCNVVKANARQTARPVTTPRPQRSIAVLATANKQQHVAKASVPKEPSSLQIATSAAAAALLMLNAGPVFAEDTLNVLTGKTPTKEVGSSVLNQDLPKVDRAIEDQPTGAVKQAAKDVEGEVITNAREFQNKLASESPNAIGAQREDKEEAKGLQANLAQVKSLLGL